MAVGPPPGFRLVAEPRDDGLLAIADAVRESDGAEVTVRMVLARLDRTQARRARDEAAALDDVLAVSKNPFVLPLLHHDRDAAGRPFLVTARRGRSLAEELAARGPLPPGTALGAVVDAAGGMELLHRNGIMHQAISPEALLRQPGGRVVLDCPPLPVLAEIAAATTEGTGHEPPEVLAGGDWTPRGEVYALASTLWTLLSGRPPFSGTRAERVLFAGQGSPGRLPDGAADLSSALRWALSADPAARPESATAFARRLKDRETPVAPGKADEQSTAVPATIRMLGEYQLLSPIGKGSMGTVWRARRADGTPVAAKLLHPELVHDPDTLMRLVREASALQDLDHPHLVRVRDLYIARGRGEAAVIMDLVDGVDLRQLLQTGELGRAEGMRLLAEVSSGLALVHESGVVHRDLKPENILVREQDGRRRALLSDFGLAKAIGNPTLTQAGYIPGTPAYLAPELVNGAAPTPASDVYALGITAYEVLARHRPFTGTTTQQVLRQHQVDRPTRPPDLPEPVWTFVAACLAKEPGTRPGALEAAGVLADLAREMALAGPDAPPAQATDEERTEVLAALPRPMDPHAARPGPVAGLPTENSPVPARPQPSSPTAGRSRMRRLILGAAVVLVAAAGAVAGILFGQHGTSTNPSPPSPLPQARVTVQAALVSDHGRITLSWSPESGSLPGLSAFLVVRDGHPIGDPLPANVFTFSDPDPVTTGCYRVFALGVATPPPGPPPAPACIP